MKTWFRCRDYVGIAAATCFLVAAGCRPASAQETAQKLPVKTSEKSKPSATPELPAQLDLLHTRVRFEVDGSSRKEVHAVVKINNELGARQFARLNFDFNRSFEQIEIPLVRVTHASGGTADILPSAISDQPNAGVVNAPAYHDVRVKSVRILGLAPGDTLEYRVITTVSHHPLAPDFWLEHSFDRTGVVSQEIFELDLPAARPVQLEINPMTPATSTEKSGESTTARVIYRWKRSSFGHEKLPQDPSAQEPDLLLTTFVSWLYLSDKIDALLEPPSVTAPQVTARVAELTRNKKSMEDKTEAIYDFVSQKITTVDLALGSTSFRTRPPAEILSSGIATSEDKYALFSALAACVSIPAGAFLTGAPDHAERQFALPSLFTHLLIGSFQEKRAFWLDPSAEVAPLGMIPRSFRGKRAFIIKNWSKVLSKYPLADITFISWQDGPKDLAFSASQKVGVDATLGADGRLAAKVKYMLRGDNELLLRVAFHQNPKDKWKDLAQLLALSDGFRGQVSNVTASDPSATHDPFTLEYEITTPKFVDWSKKPVRIPALLPQLGLPDPPAKAAAGKAAALIELGTPLDVEASLVLHLPPGTTARTPTGTAVERDYATFASHYSAKDSAVTAARHLNFILREVAAARAADYNAFIRIVQNDQAQEFTLERTAVDAPKTKTAPSTPSAPPNP